jgi:hypothetical protein
MLIVRLNMNEMRQLTVPNCYVNVNLQLIVFSRWRVACNTADIGLADLLPPYEVQVNCCRAEEAIIP